MLSLQGLHTSDLCGDVQVTDHQLGDLAGNAPLVGISFEKIKSD